VSEQKPENQYKPPALLGYRCAQDPAQAGDTQKLQERGQRFRDEYLALSKANNDKPRRPGLRPVHMDVCVREIFF